MTLGKYLVKSGARIRGVGTSTIEIIGGKLLNARDKYHVIPDRLETGSYLILSALAGKDIIIRNCTPNHIESLVNLLQESGVVMDIRSSTIHITSKNNAKRLRAVNIKTHEYPGFPTDLQAPMVVYLTQTTGESRVFETIFEGRLNYVEQLVRMGADIKLFNPLQAIVTGPTPLRHWEIEGPDIRAGLAFILAAIVAKGQSLIHNAHIIDRGCENIDGKLTGLGVDIKRV